MPVYCYTCHGEQTNTVANRATCPICGKATYNFVKTILGSQRQEHGRQESIIGVRNYFDTGMGIWIRNPKHKKEEMQKRGYVPAKSFDSWESYPDKRHQVEWIHPTKGRLVRKDGIYQQENV